VGYQLARMADTVTTVSPRAFRVLSRMCWHALDNPRGDTPARTYFGGWEALALLYPNQSPKAAHVSVGREIRELTAAGLVKPIGNPYRKQRQAYLITLPMAGG
jgi:hypothetical protein